VETKPVRNSWRWDVAGKPIAVELDLSLVDALGAEIVRAVGAVPRRGIEVGGILLGDIEAGDPALVHVRDFEAVPIEYMHGPSYVASDADFAKFAEAVRRPRSSANGPVYAVGYYRSHTRDGLSLAPEDVKLFSELFPHPNAVILIVHPSVLHASTAGFFFRENGVLHGEKSALEFPFRRQELGGGAPPQRSAREDRERRPVAAPPEPEPVPRAAPPPIAEHPRPVTRVRHTDARATEPEQQRPLFPPLAPEQPAGRLRMAWTAFLLALLTFGAVAGYYASGGRLMRNTATTDGPDPYGLRLAASGAGDGILIRWNTEAPPIRAAWRGVLNITEGQETRAIQLDLPQLRNGSVLYRHVGPAIRFRLDVYLSEQRVLSEITDWGSGPVSSAPAEIRPAPPQ
jgi:hypothetical protein